MIGIGCFLSFAGLDFAAFATYRLFPEGAFTNLIPVEDSHKSVLRRLNDIASNSVDVLDSIQDDSDCLEAIGKLQTLANEASELKRRATQLGEIDEEEFNRLASQFNSDRTPTIERLRSAGARLVQRNLYTHELSKSSIAMGLAYEDTVMAFEIGWRSLPAPENKDEELVHDKVEIQRDIWREVVAVTCKDHYDKLPNRLASFPSRYQELHDLQQEVTKQGPTAEKLITKYSKVSSSVSFHLADLKNRYETLYGINSALQEQLDAIKKAKADLMGLQMFAHSQPHNVMPTPSGPPLIGFPTKPTGAFQTTEEAFSQVLTQFAQRHGAENTVILRIYSAVKLRLQVGEIVDKVAANEANKYGGKLKSFSSRRDGYITSIVFMYKGTIDEIVSRIDFGRVVSVDSREREIMVDYRD